MKKILMLLLISSVTFLMGATTTIELLNEDFEKTFPPAGWTLDTSETGFTQSSARPYTGTYSMYHSDQGSGEDFVITPLISIGIYDDVTVTFWENINNVDLSDLQQFEVSTDMVNWTTLYDNLSAEDTYEQVSISLNAYMGQDVYLSWRYDNSYGNEWFIDDVVVTATYGDFTDINAGLEGVDKGSVAWGDYDNDGDLDILLTGENFDETTHRFSQIYRNDSGDFVDIDAGLIGVQRSSVAWGDYDNDGDLDILITGAYYEDSTWYYVASIYRNDSGVFTDINAGLEGVDNGSVAWGDYDNDGDLDVLLTGEDAFSNLISRIYSNDSGVFTDINAGLIGVNEGSVAWGDYDNDGDLDILLTGSYISKIYNNDSGVFTDINAGLAGVQNSSVAWGDYDNDGDLDILLTGSYYEDSTRYYVASIYRNDSGVFTDINAGLEGVDNGSVAWGDYDNDGDLDILLTGGNIDGTTHRFSQIYRNDSGSFTDINAVLLDVSNSSVAWGDYDNDGDLDILLSGWGDLEEEYRTEISKIYRNNTVVANTIPSKPSRLITKVENGVLDLSFDPATDNETPQNTLSYNIDLQISGEGIAPSMSDISSGYRKVAQLGNTSLNTFYNIHNFLTDLPQADKEVSWKVQAVDQCYAGSEFATSMEFAFHSPRDLALLSESEMTENDKLEWEYAYPEELDYYVIQVDDDMNFGSPLEEVIIFEKKIDPDLKGDEKIFYTGITLNSLTQFASLVNNTTYYWRVKPVYTGINRFTIFSETPLSFIYNPTGSGSLPNAPISGFIPANDDVADSSPMISWGNATDPDGNAQDLRYTIELDSVNTFSSVLFTDTTDAGETFTQVAPTLDGGYRYYYRVKTIDADSGESTWSTTQQFITVMPPSSVKITDDGANVNLTWDEMPLNAKGVVYTVYSSDDPEAVFPTGWTAVGLQLPTNAWSEPHSDSKKFYKVTVGSSSK